jgi:hypothetical protein
MRRQKGNSNGANVMAELEVAARRQNEWYKHTYETILNMANWSAFASDVERKIVCVPFFRGGHVNGKRGCSRLVSKPVRSMSF